jgi:hypothetical protein
LFPSEVLNFSNPVRWVSGNGFPNNPPLKIGNQPIADFARGL